MAPPGTRLSLRPVLSFSRCHTGASSVVSTRALLVRTPPTPSFRRVALPFAPQHAQRFPFRSLFDERPVSRRALTVAAVAGAGASIPLVLAGGVWPSRDSRLEVIDGRSYYVVQRGDSLSAISRAFGTEVDVITQANNLRSLTIQPGQSLWIPRMYTIQQGDTLYGIARRHSTTVNSILEINRIDDPNVIQADDVILLP